MGDTLHHYSSSRDKAITTHQRLVGINSPPYRSTNVPVRYSRGHMPVCICPYSQYGLARACMHVRQASRSASSPCHPTPSPMHAVRLSRLLTHRLWMSRHATLQLNCHHRPGSLPWVLLRHVTADTVMCSLGFSTLPHVCTVTTHRIAHGQV